MWERGMAVQYEFIVNPKARSGMGAMTWDMLEPELKKRRVSYRACMTGYSGHAGRIASGITADGREHCIVVLGGDGTVNETISGIVAPEKVILGYIPIGSSNDFARGLGIPKDPLEALKRILEPEKVISMDIGILVRNGKERRFAVSSGIGFDAGVCHEVCVSRWKVILNRIGLGKLSYAAVALDRLVKDRPVRAVVTFDNQEKRVFEKTYFAAFMNLPYEGGGFKFCPGASPEDGLLDVMIVSGITKFKILCLLPTAFAGRHTGFTGVTIVRCRNVVVETDRALPIHTDGEPCFLRRRVEAGILPEKLRVITG